MKRMTLAVLALAIVLSPLARAADDEVKTAIVAALAGVDPAAARERLTAAHGVVRVALEGGR